MTMSLTARGTYHSQVALGLTESEAKVKGPLKWMELGNDEFWFCLEYPALYYSNGPVSTAMHRGCNLVFACSKSSCNASSHVLRVS